MAVRCVDCPASSMSSEARSRAARHLAYCVRVPYSTSFKLFFAFSCSLQLLMMSLTCCATAVSSWSHFCKLGSAASYPTFVISSNFEKSRRP